MKLDPASLAVSYSTYLGPGKSAVVAADSAGNAYVAANTTSAAWSVTPGVLQPTCSGRLQCADFVALKVNPAGSQVMWATYLGGSGTDTIGGIAVDASGSLYLSGTTDSGDFPTHPASSCRSSPI